MRIPCPFCGDRDSAEFVYRGDGRPARPTSDELFYEYVYLRENPAGALRELWYHAQGCRNWVSVLRDTGTHEIFGAVFASGGAS